MLVIFWKKFLGEVWVCLVVLMISFSDCCSLLSCSLFSSM